MSTLIKIKNGSTEPGQTNGNEVGEPLWRTDTNTLYVRNGAGNPVKVVRAFDGCELAPAPTEVIPGYTGSVRSSLVDYSLIGANGSNSKQIDSTNTPVSLNSDSKLKLRERSPYSENAWSEIVRTESRGEGTKQFNLVLSNGEEIITDLSLSILNSRILYSDEGISNHSLFWRPSADGRSFTVCNINADLSTIDLVIIDVTDVCQSDHTLLIDKKGEVKIGEVVFIKQSKEGSNIYSEEAVTALYNNIHGDSASVKNGSSISQSWTGGDNKLDERGSIAYNLKVRIGNGTEEQIFGKPSSNCSYSGTLMITVTEDLGRMYNNPKETNPASTTSDEGDEGTE